MRTSSICVSTFLAVALASPVARCAEVSLVPVSADGTHEQNGNEIVLTGGGQRVFLELRLSDWDSDGDGVPKLRGFQVSVDSAGFSSASGNVVVAAAESCTTDAECTAAFGAGATCSFPTADPNQCSPAFIDVNRSDYVFASIVHFPVVDLSTPSFRFGGAALGFGADDPGVDQYAGTLVVDVPVGTLGTFVIELKGAPESSLQDDDLAAIEPLTLTAAVIAIACATDADCNDADACTQDTCLQTGTCSSSSDFDEAKFCCVPVDGTLVPIDDGNECTEDHCDPATGNVLPEVLFGAACGDQTQTACDDPDTCDPNGVCQKNLKPGDPACANDGGGSPPDGIDPGDGDDIIGGIDDNLPDENDAVDIADDLAPGDAEESDDSSGDGLGDDPDALPSTPAETTVPDVVSADESGGNDEREPDTGPVTRGPCGIAMVQTSLCILLGLSGMSLSRRRAKSHRSSRSNGRTRSG